jgi:phenylacetate-CoA ligase
MNELFRTSLNDFIASQQPGVGDASNMQAELLRPLLRGAVAHVPLYRDLYRGHKIDIDNIVRPDDLWRLPSVSKHDYLRVGAEGHVDERVSRSLPDLPTQKTSGSLGATLTLYSTKEEMIRQHASLWAAWISHGVTAQDRLLMMSAWHLERQIPPFLSTFIPYGTPIETTVRLFEQFQPTIIIGVVESIALLAKEVAERNIRGREKVRAIFHFGVTYSAQMRRWIESAFDAHTTDLYGCFEAGWLGSECDRHNGFHIPEDRVIVQIARTGKPDEPAANGELGEVIVTSLMRSTMPFIRYRLHDAAAIDRTPCACGRTSPRIVNLEGRWAEFVVGPDGQLHSPATLSTELSLLDQDQILDHRIVQDSPDHVRVSLVLVDDLNESERAGITAILQRYFGDVKIDIERVAEIPCDPSGKRMRIYRTFDLPGV